MPSSAWRSCDGSSVWVPAIPLACSLRSTAASPSFRLQPTAPFRDFGEQTLLAMGDLVMEECRFVLIQLDKEPKAGADSLADLLGIACQIAGNQP